jgi:hypothetical protein
VVLGFMIALGLASAQAVATESPLPFNPVDDAEVGTWVRYRLIDPVGSAKGLPGEIYRVAEVGESEVLIIDGGAGEHRFPRGQAGRSAAAFVRGFLGVLGSQLEVSEPSVTPDAVRVGDRTFAQAVRVEARTSRSLPGLEGEERPAPVEAELRLWISPHVGACGIVRAEITVRIAGTERRGVLELEAEGGSDYDPRAVPG